MKNITSLQENIHAVVGVGELEPATSVVVEREHCAGDSLLVADGAINISKKAILAPGNTGGTHWPPSRASHTQFGSPGICLKICISTYQFEN